jgi:aryl-alcohol dehydrogenase-like predicted oxidoreductase
MFTGSWKKAEDIPAAISARFPRFTKENWDQNKKFLDKIAEIAERKGVTPAQVAIAWGLTVGDNIIPIPGTTTVSKVIENVGAANVELTKDEIEELDQFADETEVEGERYPVEHVKHLWA